ncbi:MAG: hypothetical protein EOP85_04245 [Verrucomicrobiaceae bacterium]|nr:MAG: hypothetical protein EOP85_04245 [Verrucomicrobiaceae bacterium]
MKPFLLTTLIALPIVLASCGEKPSEKTAEAAATEATSEGVVLSKKDFLPPVGTVTKRESSMVMKDSVLKVQAGPQEVEGTSSHEGSSKETFETVSADKVRRVIISRKSGGKMTINGNDQPTGEKPEPLEGLPVLLERKDGKWTASLESGEQPDEDQKKGLDKMVEEITRNTDFQMYGDTPRKVGDKWEVDPATLTSFADSRNLTGDYSVEFVAIEEFQGTKCAVLKATFEMAGEMDSEGNPEPLKMTLKGTALAKRSIVDMVDLDVVVDGTVSLKGSPAENVQLEVTGPIRITEQNSVGKN